jgi:hypothetical protein
MISFNAIAAANKIKIAVKRIVKRKIGTALETEDGISSIVTQNEAAGTPFELESEMSLPKTFSVFVA